MQSYNFFSELRGVEVCGETVFEVLSDKLPQKLVWPGYGFYIEIPAGALPPGVTVSVAVRAILKGEFSLPENSKLVSAIYWVSCSKAFVKDVAVSIQHCAVISSEEKTRNLNFVVAECTQDMPYNFVERDGVFNVNTQYATIQRKSFSLFAIIAYYLGFAEKKYRALKFYQKISHLSVDANLHFVILADLEATISEVNN